MTYTKAEHSSEWYTPSRIVDAARTLMGEISLDPASCKAANEHVGARGFYSKELDGLVLPWHGNVWLNPPYGKHQRLKDWIGKLVQEYVDGRVKQACVIVPNYTAQQWFMPLWQHGPACFLSKRVRFIRSDGTQGDSPMCGHVVFWLPTNRQYGVDEVVEMATAFEGIGTTVVRIGS